MQDLCDDINQRWQTRQQRKRDRDIAKENQSQMPASEKPSQPNPSPTPATKKNQVAPTSDENGIEMKKMVISDNNKFPFQWLYVGSVNIAHFPKLSFKVV